MGEENLIRAIRGWLGRPRRRPPAGSATIAPCCARPGARQLLTVDPVDYGRHFDARLPPRRGAKLLKRNLSDLAAMGGRPSAAVVALTLDSRVAWTGWSSSTADSPPAPGATACRSWAATSPRRRHPRREPNPARRGRGPAVLGPRRGSASATGSMSRVARRQSQKRAPLVICPRLAEGAWLARRSEVSP